MTRLPTALSLTLLLSGAAGTAQSVASIVVAPSTSPARPGQATASLTYTVKTGDTLYRIATERGLTVEQLMKLNGMSTAELVIGQVLKIPTGTPTGSPSAAAGSVQPAAPAPPAVGTTIVPPVPSATATPATPAADASPVRTLGGSLIAGVRVRVPARLKMGDAFVLRLSGARAGEAQISFPSEAGEDVRKPAEALTPTGAAGEYVVLGRVVLGKTTPLTYAVKIGTEVLKGSVPVSGLEQPIQHLTLAKSLTDRISSPNRPAEEKVVEAAYALRTPQAWARPFAPPLVSKLVSSSFGQPRTYLAGGPVAYHYGTDFPAPVGTPVKAVNDGRVVIAANYPVRGGLVAIDHGAGLLSMYFHQNKLLVKVGQSVKRGQMIGQVGTTGLSAGPHLHLEMRVRGEGTLPSEYFNRLWP